LTRMEIPASGCCWSFTTLPEINRLPFSCASAAEAVNNNELKTIKKCRTRLLKDMSVGFDLRLIPVVII